MLYRCSADALRILRLMLDTSLMFMEISVMEQKYQAVLAVIRDGVSIVEVANRFGVSRQSIHSWLLRYETEGKASLTERSHRPQRCVHQMSSAVEVRVIELRRQNLFWGPQTHPVSITP